MLVNSSRLLILNLYIHLRRSRDVFLRGGRTYAVRTHFSSLWAAFTLTVHINALYNESIHGKEEHAT